MKRAKVINSEKYRSSGTILARVAVVSLYVTMSIAWTSPSGAEPRRVCVVTLENLDAAGDSYWLGHFIADSINKNLSILPELKVSLQIDLEDLQPGECLSDVALRIYGTFHDEGDTLAVSSYCVRKGMSTRPGEASFVSSFADLYPRLAELAVSLAGFAGVDYSQAQLVQIRRPPTSSQKAMSFYGKALCSPALSTERGLWLLRAISEDPSYTDALSRLGIFYYKTGAISEAMVTLERLAKIDPGYPHLHYNLGFVHRANGEHALAIEMYRKAVEIQPNDADAWNNLGAVYFLAGLHEEAAAAFEHALQIHPENAGIQANLRAVSRAVAQSAGNTIYQPSEAMAMVRHIDAGAAFYAVGDYYRAVEEFEKALLIDSANFKANNNIALSYVQLGEFEKARDHFEIALMADPSAEEVRQYLEKITAELKQSKPDKEEAPDTEETILDPSRKASALSAAGRVYLARGAYGSAAEMFRQSLQLASDNTDALISLGQAYFGLGEYDNANSQFSAAVGMEPENMAAKARLAETEYVLTGRNEDSMVGQPALQDGISSIEARACLVRGNWLLNEGLYARAAAEYLHGLDFAPALTEAHNNLANAYHMMGQHEQAEAALAKARMLEPNNVMVIRNMDAIGSIVDIYEGAELEPLEIFVLNPEHDERYSANNELSASPDDIAHEETNAAAESPEF
jgi:tetratricopeptide (TPR) repeat protein